jgi:ABC-type transporter Mla MlaB component
LADCPKCGSNRCYIHDKGWEYIYRLLTMNSRMVCQDCRTTWKRRSPEKFAKLKRRSPLRSGKKLSGYRLIPVDDLFFHADKSELLKTVAEWQEEGRIFICLDIQNITTLDTSALSNLMQIHRQLRAVGGDLIITNGTTEINNSIWALNLGYLLRGQQHVVVGDETGLSLKLG